MLLRALDVSGCVSYSSCSPTCSSRPAYCHMIHYDKAAFSNTSQSRPIEQMIGSLGTSLRNVWKLFCTHYRSGYGLMKIGFGKAGRYRMGIIWECSEIHNGKPLFGFGQAFEASCAPRSGFGEPLAGFGKWYRTNTATHFAVQQRVQQVHVALINQNGFKGLHSNIAWPCLSSLRFIQTLIILLL